jgi:uncharacterized protein YgbK (DUF1537 family)
VITVVLDDDPTGAQAISDVPVILDWTDEAAWSEVHQSDHAVHLLTNSRAHTAVDAGRLVSSAANAAKAHLPQSRFVLRGDSTLRGHVWDEYEALAAVLTESGALPLLLVPALPAAGRVTIDGIHMIEREGQRVPLHATEYATDGEFAYGTSELALWAQERSDGRLHAEDALYVPLDLLRGHDGAQAMATALRHSSGLGRPAVVIPDAETEADLRVIAAGLELAEQAGTRTLVRSGPAFVAELAGTRAAFPARLPESVAGGSVLVICGSFVPTTSAQLAHLAERRPGVFISAPVRELASENWPAAVPQLAARARKLLDSEGLAVVATDRVRDPDFVSTASQRRIAIALAQVAQLATADIVIAKGGITSAVTALDGLGATSARVVGPLVPGVSLWMLPGERSYLVVPGNVGEPELLSDVITLITSMKPAAQC